MGIIGGFLAFVFILQKHVIRLWEDGLRSSTTASGEATNLIAAAAIYYEKYVLNIE